MQEGVRRVRTGQTRRNPAAPWLQLAQALGLARLAGLLQTMTHLRERPMYSITTTAKAAASAGRPVTYRTHDGRFSFQFCYENLGLAGWRVYLITLPDYGKHGRPSDLHSTHRLSEGNRHYICWSQPLSSLDIAITVSCLWSEATAKYLRNGTRF